jgi:hypothetical protein
MSGAAARLGADEAVERQIEQIVGDVQINVEGVTERPRCSRPAISSRNSRQNVDASPPSLVFGRHHRRPSLADIKGSVGHGHSMARLYADLREIGGIRFQRHAGWLMS